MTDTNMITKLGFKPLSAILHPRIILALSAFQKFGKTHLGLTAPGPIGFFNIDGGDEGVVDKFVGSKVIHDFKMAVPTGDDMQDKAKEMWNGFVPAFDYALANFRSVVIDTASELWEILRMARFGKLTEIMPYQYTPVNSEFRELFYKSKQSTGTNVIFLHRLKAEYIKNVSTGGYVPAWFNKTPYEAQVVATMRRYEKNEDEGIKQTEFRLFIDDCRHQPTLNKTELPAVMSNFPTLAQMVIPSSKAEDWQ